MGGNAENELPTDSLSVQVKESPGLRGPIPRIAIRQDQFVGHTTPFLVDFTIGRASWRVFAFRAEDMRTNATDRSEVVEPPFDAIYVSPRLAKLCELEPLTVAVVTPVKTWTRKIAPVDIDDIPEGMKIHTSNLGRGWVMASVSGLAVPMKIVNRRNQQSSMVRLGRHARVLTAASIGENIQLSELKRRSIRESMFNHARVFRSKTTLRTKIGNFISPISWGIRAINSSIEFILRIYFHAPEFAMRVTHAFEGDDQDDIAGINPSIWGRLGISAGDQVIIRWGRNKSIATVFTDSSDSPPAPLSDAPQGIDNFYSELDGTIPNRLLIHLSALTRRDLGCPVDTVVTVRRRLTSLVRQHLSLLLLPIMTLSISAAALDNKNWYLLGIGFTALSILSFSTIRMHRSPKGPWP